jgi:hypothetical protein
MSRYQFTQYARGAEEAPLAFPLPWPFRFMSKVAMGEGCWLWLGSKDRHGYGKWSEGYRTIAAHRQAYMWTYGPTDLFILHECDTRACVRPTHLKPGTHQQNMADAKARGTMRRSR